MSARTDTVRTAPAMHLSSHRDGVFGGGGRIRCESESGEEAHGEESTRRTPPPRGHILVVDDNSVNRAVICATLEPVGFAVTVANSAQEGLALARRGRFDLILSDLHMPREDGFSFLLATRNDAQLRTIPFVIITSSVWPEKDQAKALALGAAAVILRPIEAQALIDIMTAWLARQG